ncbi:CLUMA_CG012521, isoform A [Clunio marinus]|uniref:CLUMA_CG012521, isoform A n=1 Tax=Clunio marinus TaxID=568069 RepID=A0A1J1IG50_9DIPT|nr:CLUMA_CG012521, isoform A [Clunio marinus]
MSKYYPLYMKPVKLYFHIKYGCQNVAASLTRPTTIKAENDQIFHFDLNLQCSSSFIILPNYSG